MNPTQSDSPIDEIRYVRHRISGQFGHNPAKLVAYYLELQKQHEVRLRDAKVEPKGRDEAAGL